MIFVLGGEYHVWTGRRYPIFRSNKYVLANLGRKHLDTIHHQQHSATAIVWDLCRDVHLRSRLIFSANIRMRKSIGGCFGTETQCCGEALPQPSNGANNIDSNIANHLSSVCLPFDPVGDGDSHRCLQRKSKVVPLGDR